MKTEYVAIGQKVGGLPEQIAQPFWSAKEVDACTARFVKNNPGSCAWVETIEVEETK